LIPFLIINGILTAIPVVIYNNDENLGKRIYTIPIEDTVYALTMLLGVVSIMEYLRKKVKD
jgi:lycopene cyclase domain-containing protein